jgi:flagella basal body P-ring formation protein FlgA
MLLAIILTCCLNTPPEVTVDAASLSVGAVVASMPASDPRAAVSLGFAPNPGLARRIPGAEIVDRIQAAGLSVDGLQFPESILVHRRSQAIDENQVRRAVMEAFTAKFPDAKVSLTSVEIPAVQVGSAEVDIAASLPPSFDPGGPVFVKLDIRNANYSRSVFVRVSVRLETVQPVLKNRIAANSEIHAADVEWKLAVLAGNREALGSDQILDGMLAKRDLEPGEVLNEDSLYSPLYVHRGDSVTVRAISGAVTISATMRAKASGRLGDIIPVEQLTGTGGLTARIVGPRVLEVIQR